MKTLGYALAMRVLQSDLFKGLDDLETRECMELIDRGLCELVAESHASTRVVDCHCPRCVQHRRNT